MKAASILSFLQVGAKGRFRTPVALSAGMVVLAGLILFFGSGAFLPLPKRGSVHGSQAKRPALSPTEIDLGVVPPDAKIERTIALTNTTGRSLRVVSVKADCGCLVQEITPPAVESGESFNLHFRYAAPSVPGSIQRAIALQFQEQPDQPAVIAIKGFVRPWAYADPSEVAFIDAPPGQLTRRWLTIATCPARALTPQDFQTEMPNLRVESVERIETLHPVDREKQSSYRLCLLYNPPAHAPQITVHGDLKLISGEKSLSVPVHGNVTPVVTCHPARVFFGIVKPSATREFRFVLKVHDSEATFRGRKPRITHTLQDELSFQIKEQESGKSLVVTCSYRPNALTGGRKGIIKIQDIPGDSVQVPVDAWVE